MHRSLIDAVRDRNVDVLLMEGTHIGHLDHRGPTEYELEDEIVRHVQSAPALVLTSFSPQQVDRPVGFYRATVRAGRIFVPDAYTAFVMHLIASETPIPKPECSEHIRVFFPRFFQETFEKKRLESFFSLMSPAGVEMEEIRSNPSRYVMQFQPSMLESDFCGTLPPGSRCLYSRWSGYLDRSDWRATLAALKQGSGDLIEAHTSGHIYSDDIVDLVGQINAKIVIPTHTFEPERFAMLAAEVKLLADGETLCL